MLAAAPAGGADGAGRVRRAADRPCCASCGRWRNAHEPSPSATKTRSCPRSAGRPSGRRPGRAPDLLAGAGPGRRGRLDGEPAGGARGSLGRWLDAPIRHGHLLDAVAAVSGGGAGLCQRLAARQDGSCGHERGSRRWTTGVGLGLASFGGLWLTVRHAVRPRAQADACWRAASAGSPVAGRRRLLRRESRRRRASCWRRSPGSGSRGWYLIRGLGGMPHGR